MESSLPTLLIVLFSRTISLVLILLANSPPTVMTIAAIPSVSLLLLIRMIAIKTLFVNSMMPFVQLRLLPAIKFKEMLLKLTVLLKTLIVFSLTLNLPLVVFLKLFLMLVLQKMTINLAVPPPKIVPLLKRLKFAISTRLLLLVLPLNAVLIIAMVPTPVHLLLQMLVLN